MRNGRGKVTTAAHPRACGENSVDLCHRRLVGGSSPRVRGKCREGGLPVLRVGLIPARAGKIRPRTPPPTPPPAHPRACGENRAPGTCLTAMPGSSPRVRGKSHRPGRRPRRNRLIPARAGKIGQREHLSGPFGAHPRACGENPPPPRRTASPVGSSPRVRGKCEGACSNLNRAGLIPARAGKIARPPTPAAPGRAHPRACGENVPRLNSAPASAGSSPRVRGKLMIWRPTSLVHGLIPARAGKISPPRPPCEHLWAHPRACGENPSADCFSTLRVGSSPRVRGKLLEDRRRLGRDGLIPARAGKIPAAPGRTWIPRAHPRACGENDRRPQGVPAFAGSSPRVRGKSDRQRRRRQRQRLIPARAGKIYGRPRTIRTPAAHPRACGENPAPAGEVASDDGSSPRVRGKSGGRAVPRARVGLIPARAGTIGGGTG